MSSRPDTAVLLRALAAEQQRQGEMLATILRLLERGRGRDAADDARLMTALAARVGGLAFSAGELLAHTHVDDTLAQALHGLATPRHVGKRLRALADRPIAGFVLQAVDRDAAGTIWIVQVAHLHTHARQDDGAGA